MPSEPPISRRGLIAALGGAASLGVGAVLGTDVVLPPLRLDARVPAGEWPMEKRDPQRTGYQPLPGPRQGLVEEWRQPDGSTNVVSPGLVASSGRVYTAGRFTVRAVAGSDGSLDWTRRRRDGFPSISSDDSTYEFLQTGPTVSGDRLYVVGGVTLYGHEAASGRSTWAFRTNSSFDRVLPVGNLLVLGVFWGNDEQLLALDQSTGLERWTRTTPEIPLAYASADDDRMERSLLLTGTTVQGVRGRLVGRDPVDGSVRWRTAPDSQLFGAFATPAINQGRVYAGGSTLTAFATNDGSVLWQTEVPEQADVTSPVTDGERVYLASGDTAVAVDAATGDRRWEAAVDETSPYVPPVLAGETLYLPGESAIVALDTTDGSTRFRHDLSGADTRVYGMASADGKLYAKVGQSLRGYAAPEEDES